MTACAESRNSDPALAHACIAEYYTQKVKTFGCTPFGADWTCIATQEMRFVQLLKLCDFNAPFSLNDLGCGYGALAGFVHRRYSACSIDYLGIDLSSTMVRRARQHCRGLPGVRFVTGWRSPRMADYAVASGIFNVQLKQPQGRWDAFIKATLHHLAATSRRGFAVNFVAPQPGSENPARGLYSTQPEPWVSHCAGQFGAKVQVIDGYGLREFSLLVRLPPVG